MPRAKNRVAARARKRKILKQAKGYWGARKNLIKTARLSVNRAMQYAYRDRRVRKREFRKLWIVRINAAVREYGLSYSKFMDLLNKADIELNRKVLADLAVNQPETFERIVKSLQTN